MIYIGATNDIGSAIYFDIHVAERLGRNLCISGTLGDGSYEGEVIVEIGRTDCVTFADAWLGGFGFADFTRRCDMELIEDALLDSLRVMPLFGAPRVQPHGPHRDLNEPVVTEEPPLWKRLS